VNFLYFLSAEDASQPRQPVRRGDGKGPGFFSQGGVFVLAHGVVRQQLNLFRSRGGCQKTTDFLHFRYGVINSGDNGDPDPQPGVPPQVFMEKYRSSR